MHGVTHSTDDDSVLAHLGHRYQCRRRLRWATMAFCSPARPAVPGLGRLFPGSAGCSRARPVPVTSYGAAQVEGGNSAPPKTPFAVTVQNPETPPTNWITES